MRSNVGYPRNTWKIDATARVPLNIFHFTFVESIFVSVGNAGSHTSVEQSVLEISSASEHIVEVKRLNIQEKEENGIRAEQD